MNKKTLDNLQERAGEVCVFLGMNRCSKNEINPEYCIHGDYIMCDKYHALYKAISDKERRNERE